MTAFICNENSTTIAMYLTYDNIDTNNSYTAYQYNNIINTHVNSLYYNGTSWFGTLVTPRNVHSIFSINSNLIQENTDIKLINIGNLTQVNKLVWNKSIGIYVAVGVGSDSNHMYSSYDGITWSVTLGDKFTYYCLSVACNSGFFIAVGDRTTAGSNILTSNNGITWYKINTGFFSDGEIVGVVWNKAQSTWIIFGDDGLSWNIIYNDISHNWKQGSKDIFSSVTNIVCNDHIWVAVGDARIGGKSGDCMAYSSDGKSWIPMGKICDRAYGVIWNGNFFIAKVMMMSDQITYIIYSSDGETWTKLNMNKFGNDIISDIQTSFITDQ